MPFITHPLAFADALRLVVGAAEPISRTETMALLAADGRVVARDVHATVDVPPFDRAAMDGYAVIAADTAGARSDVPRPLICVGSVFTGQVPDRAIDRGECVAIATGAPMPAGADAVVMVEETDRDGEVVRVHTAVTRRQHVGARAADIRTGHVVVSAGQVLNPSRLGALAATGIATVEVYARPTVSLVSTGNEIAAPGMSLGPGQIHDVNRVTLAAVIARHGGDAVALPPVADTIADLSRAIDVALHQDVVVFSGGSSVGERDLIVDLLRSRGEMIFHGIAVKPGKPTGLARVGGKPVFAMPGYPTSCLSNAYMLLVPFLRTMARLPPWEPRTIELPLARRIVSAAGRHQFYSVRMANGMAEPAFKSSGDITSMANADGYIEIPAGIDAVDAGTPVVVRLF